MTAIFLCVYFIRTIGLNDPDEPQQWSQDPLYSHSWAPQLACAKLRVPYFGPLVFLNLILTFRD